MTDHAMDRIDLLIVGGGINGAGIARDAAGRGLSVLLVEQDDLASHTSSASTKLIHGGLRYLEYGEFRLVREALIERERLLNMAPHIIWPLSFVLPQTQSPRPAWMVRLGLFLYDHLGGRESCRVRARWRWSVHRWVTGFRRERARLSFIRTAGSRTAAWSCSTRWTRPSGAQRSRPARRWSMQSVRAMAGSRRSKQRAKPAPSAPAHWSMRRALGRRRHRPHPWGAARSRVRLVKGSHIIVPKLYDGDHAFMLQNDDRRIVFAIPYEGRFTLVGTTDEPWTDAPAKASISAAETTYLLDTVNRYFARKTGQADIVWSYAGIRPLYDDHSANASAVTRDYVLDLDTGAEGEGRAPMLNIFGGKITTYRKLAEHAMRELARFFPAAGERGRRGRAARRGYRRRRFRRFPARIDGPLFCLAPVLLRRLARAYGTRVDAVVGQGDLGPDLGGGLHTAEVDYQVKTEWARTVEDILYRRSKLGLHVPSGTPERLAAYLAEQGIA